jgi:solute carrier family 25 carnitine/acylcarnitine transporter 20/29
MNETSSNYSIMKDYISGIISGAVRIGVGYPQETLRTRMQTIYGREQTSTAFFGQIYRREGIRGFYQGSGALFIGTTAATALEFGVYKQLLTHLEPTAGTGNDVGRGPIASSPLQKAGVPEFFIAGAAAGLVQSVVTIPVEHCRSRMQVQTDDRATIKYKNSIDAYRSIFRLHGIRGLYKGTCCSLLRDVPGCACYFTAYEYTKRRMQQFGPLASTLAIPVAGIVSSLGYWGSIYPFDVVKSKIQTDCFEKPKYTTTFNCFQLVWRSERWSGLYRGFAVCMTRSIPVNVIMFLAYEKCRAWL